MRKWCANAQEFKGGTRTIRKNKKMKKHLITDIWNSTGDLTIGKVITSN